MPKPYSYDLRVGVIESIEAGASRRETAELDGLAEAIEAAGVCAALSAALFA
jgi:hypothetical protein